MAKVADVAAYILEKGGCMSGWKLQKLVYYCQAWHLVWEDKVLFEEKIEAWANGPVAPALYKLHAGAFEVTEIPEGDPRALSDEEMESIAVVLGDYGRRSGQWLSELAHMESPWKEARQRCGCKPGDRCNEVIQPEAMALYYGGLLEPEEPRDLHPAG